jgi:hypothetical protein
MNKMEATCRPFSPIRRTTQKNRMTNNSETKENGEKEMANKERIVEHRIIILKFF